MYDSQYITIETAHSLWGVERFNELSALAIAHFNEWRIDKDREDTWLDGGDDYDINLYDDLNSTISATLYYRNASDPNSPYDKYIRIIFDTYPPLQFSPERFAYIKSYAMNALRDFKAGDRERTYVGEFWGGDFELCFDTDEDDRDKIVIELYKSDASGVCYDDCYNFTEEELAN